MSTKTSIKRIALVAVSALGLGVLTSVAPASATDNVNISAVSVGASAPARVNVSSGATTVTLTHAEGSTYETVTAQITSAPSTSTAAALTFSSPTTGGPNNSPTYVASTKTDQLYTGNAGVAVAPIQVRASATTTKLTLKLNADVAGSYQILVTANAASAAGYSTGKISTSYTITTAGAPTAVSISKYAGSVVSLTTANALAGVAKYGGALYAISLKDANGNATVLGLNEALTISDNSDATTKLYSIGSHAASSLPTEISSFGSGDDVSGNYYVRVVADATLVAGTGTLTATGSGLLPATLTSNTSYTKVLTADEASSKTITCTTSTNCVTSSGSAYVAGNNTMYVAGATSLTLGVAGDTTAAEYIATFVVDKLGMSYNDALTVAAATTAATSVTYTGPSVDATYTSAKVQLLGGTTSGNSGLVTISYQVPAAKTVSVVGADSVLSATGGNTTWTVQVKDQYGNGIPYVAVTVAVTGRNTVVERSIGVTGSTGYITYTHSDTGATGTKDTLTFDSGALDADVAYVTYGTVTVDSVAVTGGSTVADAGVAGTTLTAISAADNGPEASAKAITATVKDANGNLLAGVPVTFAVSSGLVKKTAAVDYATVYTGSDGTAVSYVFDWVPGTQTITATAGGKSGTDYLTWAATDATSARVLSATAAGNVVSVKVVDRFGNGVKGVSVSLSRVGTGFFGNGTSTATLTTDKSGTADIQFNGSASVVAELDTATYVQAGDVAGKIAATAVTAAVAGTTTGTGASLAPAGVNKVTVDVTDNSSAATDAANEATDAANAATDAANAAAEAADAATAAAQDAQAAVAALATEVAAMISGIKAQIIRLTNLVVKIQKKVGA